jgi:hypothetical protein
MKDLNLFDVLGKMLRGEHGGVEMCEGITVAGQQVFDRRRDTRRPAGKNLPARRARLIRNATRSRVTAEAVYNKRSDIHARLRTGPARLMRACQA